MGHIQGSDMQEAWCSVHGQYKEVGAQQVKKCHGLMEKQPVKREDQYALVPPPGDPLHCNHPASTTNDTTPRDAEIRSVVKALRNIRASNTLGAKAENLKTWLVMAENKEKARVEGEEEYKGRGNT
jgi:hypothetical protein